MRNAVIAACTFLTITAPIENATARCSRSAGSALDCDTLTRGHKDRPFTRIGLLAFG